MMQRAVSHSASQTIPMSLTLPGSAPPMAGPLVTTRAFVRPQKETVTPIKANFPEKFALQVSV